MPNSRICGKSGKTVGASALQSETQTRERRICPLALIGFHQTEKRVPNRLGQHGGFGATLLMLHDHQWLIKIRVTLAQLLLQNLDLCMLAAQTEYRCSRHVGMMEITRNEPAQILRILARSSAPAFMQKKSDAIQIPENSRTPRNSSICLLYTSPSPRD